MSLHQFVNSKKLSPKRNFWVFESLFDRVRNVGAAPGVATALKVTVFQGTKIAAAFRGIDARGQKNGFDFHFALIMEKTLEEDMPVFGNDIRVPVINSINHFQRGRISGIVQVKIFWFQAMRKVGDISHGTDDSDKSGYSPIIVVPNNRRLPEAIVALWIQGKSISQNRE